MLYAAFTYTEDGGIGMQKKQNNVNVNKIIQRMGGILGNNVQHVQGQAA